MIIADELKNDWPQAEISGLWVLSKPVPAPFIVRLRDAWTVLCGRAEAVEFVTESHIKKKRCDNHAAFLKKETKEC